MLRAKIWRLPVKALGVVCLLLANAGFLQGPVCSSALLEPTGSRRHMFDFTEDCRQALYNGDSDDPA